MSGRGISTRRGRIGATALAGCALLCLLALTPAAARAATGSISGTVTDASTSDPIEGVEACAYPEGAGGSYGCAITESDGSYTIAELEPGEYFVEIWPAGAGYGSQYFESILVGSGDTVVDAQLVRKAAIEGTVIATADGLPVEEIEVCAFDVEWDEFGGCAWTGSDGTYSLPLYEGDFKVEFWPGSSGRNLAVQFYDHQDRWNDAAVISLTEGEWVSGIDAELGPGATLSGHVSNASGQPLDEIRVCSIDAPTGQPWICTRTGPAGNYSMRFHSAAAYKVVFSPDMREFFPEAWPEDDGFPTEFWNNQPTLAAANLISLSTGQSMGGINAMLGTLPAPPPAFAPPPAAKPPVVAPRKRKCRRGFRKKRIKGKVRCVKVRKKRHHRRGGKSKRLAVPARLLQ